MPSEPATPVSFDESVLAQLACPACHGRLRLEAASLICAVCHRAYPVLDGIPILIPDRAGKAES